jgi:hypothetical protein
MTPESVATLNLKSAIALMGTEWVQAALSIETTVSDSPTGTRRGRKPGAAPSDIRCTWMSADKQCKNTKCDDTPYCKIHQAKQAAIDAAAGGGASE